VSAELAGRVALVTGAARNIGRAIALDLARAGAAVVVNARNDRAGAEAVAGEIEAAGGRALAHLADVTDEAAVAAMIEAVRARFGRLDVLVNNAAVRRETALGEMSLAEWREVTGIVLDGAFLTTRAALPLLEASDAGAIVNIGGLTAYTGAANRAHVVAAKAGLDGLTKALAHELAAKGITVNLVSPGLIETARGAHAPANPSHHKRNATLLGRRGEPEEVAAWVRRLAGPDARFMTGQTIHVNGGAFLP
jgi:3-oxoacyl-[acyl-carrier protein] reductase